MQSGSEAKLWIDLSAQPLDTGAVMKFLVDERAGGINVFVGTTRRWTRGRETRELQYEAYEPMAVREMERLAKGATERWPTSGICILHRLGVVPISEASVIIGVATGHRDAAFAACRFLIDGLKQEVPIWKREVYADGTVEWVGAQPDNRPLLQ
jgi:molybdopterin synthase catalytic subunit